MEQSDAPTPDNSADAQAHGGIWARLSPFMAGVVSLVCAFLATACIPVATSSSREPIWYSMAKIAGLAAMLGCCLRIFLGSRGAGRVVPALSLLVCTLVVVGIVLFYTGIV